MNANGAKHEAQVAGWAERVRECRSSGMSVKACCEEQGINTSTYYRWEREILGKADKERERQAEQEEADREPKLHIPVKSRTLHGVLAAPSRRNSRTVTVK